MSDDDEDQDSPEEIEAEAESSFDDSDLDDPEIRGEINTMMKLVDHMSIDMRRELHLFHAGNFHRIGRVRVAEWQSFIGEWMYEQIVERKPEIFSKSIYLFRASHLWITLMNPEAGTTEIDGVTYLDITFDTIRTIKGNPTHSVMDNDGRVVFRFLTGEVK